MGGNATAAGPEIGSRGFGQYVREINELFQHATFNAYGKHAPGNMAIIINGFYGFGAYIGSDGCEREIKRDRKRQRERVKNAIQLTGSGVVFS